ncbi:MAG: hypothetical protein HY901_20935 [Deltaproteobacteria bacterium]|nr:hypothetical protein [Deltaproteobacteria bacterium]
MSTWASWETIGARPPPGTGLPQKGHIAGREGPGREARQDGQTLAIGVKEIPELAEVLRRIALGGKPLFEGSRIYHAAFPSGKRRWAPPLASPDELRPPDNDQTCQGRSGTAILCPAARTRTV